MEINIGDEIVGSDIRYIVTGFRPNGKIVARNPHFAIEHDYDFDMEIMPDSLARCVAHGLFRVIKKGGGVRVASHRT